jgi:hypothetical protein
MQHKSPANCHGALAMPHFSPAERYSTQLCRPPHHMATHTWKQYWHIIGTSTRGPAGHYWRRTLLTKGRRVLTPLILSSPFTVVVFPFFFDNISSHCWWIEWNPSLTTPLPYLEPWMNTACYQKCTLTSKSNFGRGLQIEVDLQNSLANPTQKYKGLKMRF